MKPLLPAMVVLNATLAWLIASMPAVSEPEPPTIVDPVSSVRSDEVPIVVPSVASPSITAETTMFGPSGTTGRTIGTPTKTPSLHADDIHLLGVLMAQQGGDRQSIMLLLRHGSPPVVSRLTLGGTLDGWKLVSATGTTVTLSGANGTTKVLQVGAHAPGVAPR